ncbi:MAG: pyrroline-5-carboxylate reductase [Pseudomonadota bacterium]
MKKVILIGGGNMASALLGGWKKKSLVEEAWVIEPKADQREWLHEHYQVHTAATISEAPANDVDAWILAIKPQVAKTVLAQLPQPPSHMPVISVMTGIRLETLQRCLHQHKVLIRAMPNTPALIQAGVTGLFAAESVDLTARKKCEKLFRAVGRVVWCDAEKQLDAITALSGSGPGFVFYMMEAFLEAARELELPNNIIDELVSSTFGGAIALAQHSHESPGLLRARVTSPGGTTEAGILTLDSAQVGEHIQAAILKAAHRARQLGDELSV